MAAPSVSLIVPTYNVERYLADFFKSLDAQGLDPDEVEIVFVNDGSTDNSAQRIEEWIDGSSARATLVNQANSGLSAARNRGLDEATGDWVSFPDPDDFFGKDYLKSVCAFLTSSKAADVHLVCTNAVIFEEATGKRLGHPLRYRFAEGERIVDLDRHPLFVHLQSASAFYRRALLDEFELRFDSRVRPNFEDGHLTTLYLSYFDHPTVAVLPAPRYMYRRRSDQSSLVQSSWSKREKFVELPRYGYLDLLERIAQRRGRVPLWAQNVVLYDLAFYFRTDARVSSPTASLSPDASQQFHDLLTQILTYIDAESIRDFRVTWLAPEMRAAMLLGGKGLTPRPDSIQMKRIDKDRKLVCLEYFYSGELPDEEFRARGYRVRPVYGKSRAISYLGRVMLHHRIVWLPATGTLSVALDGKRIPIELAAPKLAFDAGPTLMWRTLADTTPPADASTKQAKPRPRLVRWKHTVTTEARKFTTARGRKRTANDARDRALRTYATVGGGQLKYRDAWLLIDRDSQAQDNAEHLYRYLRAEQPHINAWFVLARDSDDWERLADEGFRLLEHGSWQHHAALMNCVQLVSSQVDDYIVNPLPRRFARRGWHFTFLQHGVIKDDLSNWLNFKPIDIMLTSSPAEYESIVGDGTPYVMTDKEAQLAGLPRHDALLARSQRNRDPRKTLLVMPTWRRELLLDRLVGGNDRALRDDFWASEYAVEWRAFMESATLHEALDERGWSILFVPHPNMQGYLDNHPLDPRVTVKRFRDIDFQQVLTTAGALVTDYSSIAFEMALIDRPLVYFQFDQERFFSGSHPYRRADFWSYERDGFGPVAIDVQTAVDATIEIIARGKPEPDHQRKMTAAFAHRDGQNCRRTYEAITELTRPMTYDELYLKRED